MANKLLPRLVDTASPELLVDTNDGAWATRVAVFGSAPAAPAGATAGGSLLSRKIISTADVNATLVRAGAYQVQGIQLINTGVAAAYLKIYSKATAPTVGTDTPVLVVGIPAGGRVEVSRQSGIYGLLGLGYGITALPADSDTTAVTAGQVVGSIEYA